MPTDATENPSGLIRRARHGDPRDLGVLLERYRPYLKLLARLQSDARVTPKLDDSDMVQETSLLAARNFTTFRGSSEPELTAWLRTIMSRVAAQSLRHYTSRQRDIRLEQSLERSLEGSSALLASSIPSSNSPSPSEGTMLREQAVLVAEAIDQLPDHYREIIILRNLEGLTLDTIGAKTGRSSDSVRKMWARAIVMVRDALEARYDD